MSVAETVVSGSLLLAGPLALAAGALSFFSPCVLPLAPGYLAYITGMSGNLDLRDRTKQAERVGAASYSAGAAQSTETLAGDSVTADTPDLAAKSERLRMVVAALLFVLGFSAVFVAYGAAFGGLGTVLLEHARLLTVIAGSLVLVLGLGFMGLPVISQRWWWNRDRRSTYRPPRGLWGAPLLGLVFGLGWTPCIGPTLAAVQSLAFSEASATRGALLSLFYCLGLGIPFILLAMGLGWMTRTNTWMKQHTRQVSMVGGAVLVLIGVLLVTGLWSDIVIRLQGLAPGFEVAL